MLQSHAETLCSDDFRLRYITAGLNRLTEHYGVTDAEREENLTAWLALAVVGVARKLKYHGWVPGVLIASANNRVHREQQRIMRTLPLAQDVSVTLQGQPYARSYGLAPGHRHLIAVSPAQQHFIDLAWHAWRDVDAGVNGPEAVCVQVANTPQLIGAEFSQFAIMVVPYSQTNLKVDASDAVLRRMISQDAKRIIG